MIGPETGTLVFCQPCSGRQSVRIWQQYNLLKGSPNLILMIGSFLNCNGRLQNAARLKGQHMMSWIGRFDEFSNWQLLSRDRVIPHLMSQGQWSPWGDIWCPLWQYCTQLKTLMEQNRKREYEGDAVKGRGREGRDNIKYMKDICVLLGAMWAEAWDFSS